MSIYEKHSSLSLTFFQDRTFNSFDRPKIHTTTTPPLPRPPPPPQSRLRTIILWPGVRKGGGRSRFLSFFFTRIAPKYRRGLAVAARLLPLPESAAAVCSELSKRGAARLHSLRQTGASRERHFAVFPPPSLSR